MRYIVDEDDDSCIFPNKTVKEISDCAIIIVINNCGECDWKYRTAGGKYYCDHHGIKAKRPYCRAGGIYEGRKIDLETRPGWCPLCKLSK